MADPQITSQIMEVLSDPMNLPPSFWNYSVQRWLADAPVFPISQVFGFIQSQASVSAVAASVSRSSSTFATLSGGPSLSNLADGHYLVLWGAAAAGNAGVSNAEMAVGVNGVTNVAGGDHTQIAFTSSGTSTSITSGDTFTLSNKNSNTLDGIYLSSDNSFSCSWQNRWLIALKTANL